MDDGNEFMRWQFCGNLRVANAQIESRTVRLSAAKTTRDRNSLEFCLSLAVDVRREIAHPARCYNRRTQGGSHDEVLTLPHG